MMSEKQVEEHRQSHERTVMPSKLEEQPKELTFTPEMTAMAAQMAREAAQSSRMNYLMAKALIRGQLDSRVILWAEQIVSVYEKMMEEANAK